MIWARSDIEKADVFASHLEAGFQTNDVASDLNPIIEDQNASLIKPFSPKEIKKLLIKSSTQKKHPATISSVPLRFKNYRKRK